MGKVVVKMHHLGFHRLDKSTIWQYEEEERQPHPVILWGLATVYGVDYSELCSLLVNDVTNGLVGEVASSDQLSEEAVQIARAFDLGSPALQKAMRLAVEAYESTPGRDLARHESSTGVSGRRDGNRVRTRKSQGH